MEKKIIFIFIFCNLISSDFHLQKLSMKPLLGKRHGFLNISNFSNNSDSDFFKFKIYKKDLSSDESAFGFALLNANEVFGVDEKSKQVLPVSVHLLHKALVFDLLEDPIITNNKTSNDLLIKKVKEIFLAFNQTNFADTQSYSSAIVVLFLPHKIVVAHVGDSRAVSSDLNSIMTHDHKPFLPHEKQRIEKAGGVIKNKALFKKDNSRVRFFISRMFGNTKLAGIIAEPDVSIFDYNFKLLATTSHDLDTDFFPVAQFLKKMDLPLYAVNKTTTKYENNTKASSGYRFIIIANAAVWKSLPMRINDYFSWDFAACSVAADENKSNTSDAELVDYHCSRLGAAEVATHIVESVLTRYGLNEASLDFATHLLHVASGQKENFNLNSFINPHIVEKKSFFQKIKGWFIKHEPTTKIIYKDQGIMYNQQDIKNIQDEQWIVIIAWDPRKAPYKKLKTKLSHKKIGT